MIWSCARSVSTVGGSTRRVNRRVQSRPASPHDAACVTVASRPHEALPVGYLVEHLNVAWSPLLGCLGAGIADGGRLGWMPGLSPLGFSILALAASLVGLSKTALPGAGTITVAVFAAVLPARQSTGALLVLLILGDLFAVRTYHAHADWAVLRRLVPTVLAGVLVGTFFLAAADDNAVRRVIGAILLVLVALTLVRRAAARGGRDPSRLDAAGSAAGDVAPPADRAAGRRWRGRFGTGGYGVLAGFTTMVANAGGPVMSMYFLASRFSISRFLGTAVLLRCQPRKEPRSWCLSVSSASSHCGSACSWRRRSSSAP